MVHTQGEGAHIVIALTHMRWPNDMRLAREVSEIDLILGGHDHDYGVKEEQGLFDWWNDELFKNVIILLDI